MQNIQKTAMLVDRDPAWRHMVATACRIKGVPFDEELLYQLTYKLSENVQVDVNTNQIHVSVSDEELLEEVEEYQPADPQPLILQRIEAIENQINRIDQLEVQIEELAGPSLGVRGSVLGN